jgi:uncharacterized membrane protein YoaK (UPF0700 family)
VFVGLRIAGAPGPPVGRVLSSLAAFAVGAACAGWIVGRAASSGEIWPRRVSAALATALVAQVAFLVAWIVVGGRPSAGSANALIAISAFAMGVQATAIIALGVRAVVTTAATGTLAVLMGDLARWPHPQIERQRLAAMLAAVAAGATTGALLMLHARVWAALFPAAVTALVVAAAAAAFLGTRRVSSS